MAFGTSDINGSFVLIGFAICTCEDTDTYRWCVENLATEARKYGIIAQPQNLVADSAAEITVC